MLRLVSSQEAERRRIAEHIHDDTLQIMAALGLRLGTLRRFLADQRGLETLTRVDGTLHAAIVRLRHLMFDLWPRSLEDRGLAVACQESLAQLVEAGAIRDFTLEAELDPEPNLRLGLAVFRTIQRLLRNVQQHAQATVVDVRLERDDEAIRFRVRDNGVGIDMAGPRAAALLATINERIGMLGGKSRVDSAPGEGTTVDIRVPEL